MREKGEEDSDYAAHLESCAPAVLGALSAPNAPQGGQARAGS